MTLVKEMPLRCLVILHSYLVEANISQNGIIMPLSSDNSEESRVAKPAEATKWIKEIFLGPKFSWRKTISNTISTLKHV